MISKYLVPGLVITIGVLLVALGATSWLLDSARKDLATEKGLFEAFKSGVEKAGKKAEEDKATALKLQKENYDASIKSWTERHYHLGVKYELLRKSAGDTRSGDLPTVPDTTIPVDDTAQRNRLLEVLRAADVQVIQLIGLQDWVRANKNACGPVN